MFSLITLASFDPSFLRSARKCAQPWFLRGVHIVHLSQRLVRRRRIPILHEMVLHRRREYLLFWFVLEVGNVSEGGAGKEGEWEEGTEAQFGAASFGTVLAALSPIVTIPNMCRPYGMGTMAKRNGAGDRCVFGKQHVDTIISLFTLIVDCTAAILHPPHRKPWHSNPPIVNTARTPSSNVQVATANITPKPMSLEIAN